jgi:cell division protein FtsA
MLNQIVESRMRETFELVRDQIVAGGSGRLPAGIVLTGGAAQLAGTASLGREVLALPVRVAGPAGIGGLTDTLLDPAHATAVGLLEWGAAGLGAEPSHYESAPAGGIVARARDALRGLFP